MFSKFERKVAFRYLSSSKKEGVASLLTTLSVIGVALGVAALIIVMAVMNGFRHELLSKIIGMNGHVWVSSPTGALLKYDPIAEAIRKIPGVVNAVPVIERQTIITHGGQARGVQVHGIQPKDLEKRPLIAENLRQGSLKLFADKKPSLLIGIRLAEKLGVRVGDSLTLVIPQGNNTAFGTLPKQRRYPISGIFEAGMNEYDKSVIFMPLETAQTLFQLQDAVSNIEVFIKDPDQSQFQVYDIKEKFGSLVHVIDWKHGDSSYFQAVQVERNVMFLILTLIVLVAALNIISGLIMMVKEKTKSIAIFRTMGATRGSIVRIFFLSGASVGVVGTLLGLGIGLLFSYNIESIRQWLQSFTGGDLFSAEIYFLTKLPAIVMPKDVLGIVCLSLTLTFLTTLYPAWRAGTLDPVEGLKG